VSARAEKQLCLLLATRGNHVLVRILFVAHTADIIVPLLGIVLLDVRAAIATVIITATKIAAKVAAKHAIRILFIEAISLSI
jgi:hypothetical protein